MEGAEETKGYILQTLTNKIIDIEKEGCATGKVHSSQLFDTCRRVGDLEVKFWWIILFSFTTLVGVAFNIGLNMYKMGIIK